MDLLTEVNQQLEDSGEAVNGDYDGQPMTSSPRSLTKSTAVSPAKSILSPSKRSVVSYLFFF